MRVLLIDFDRTGLDMAYRAAEAGHEVRWWMPPHKDGTMPKTGNGFPGILKVKDWESQMPWAKQGLIVNLFNDRKITARLDIYRKAGYPVFGPSVKSARLEWERGEGMKFMEQHGIEVPKYHTFPTLQSALSFAWKAQDPFVFKTLGDEEDKSLSFVPSDPAELVGWLENKVKRGVKLKGSCMLQEKVDLLCEVGISGWMGTNGFLPDRFNVNFEHKRLMPGDLGPNCYDEQTEVLTREGWKFWRDVVATDEICTLRDGVVTYEVPSEFVSAKFDGELIGWESPYVDILVTPGHNMYVQDDHSRKDFWFEPAFITEMNGRNILRGAGQWVGKDFKDLDIPADAMTTIHTTFSAWCALLGTYIADGYASDSSLIYGNCPEHKRIEFQEIAKSAGYSAKMYGNDLYINSADFSRYAKSLGQSDTKRVPQFIKDASVEAIRAFLYGYGLGDGSRREGNLTYTTVSKGLADDIQELCLKAGWCANIRTRDRRGESHLINGYECINQRIAYDIGVSTQRLKASVSPQTCYRKPYSGMVYCCTVTSHIIYVRRNGKACFLGQTGETGTVCKYIDGQGQLAQILQEFEESLVKLGHIGDTDIGGAITKDGRYIPFEWSLRFGWPSTFILFASHRGDPVEWMKGLLEGRDELQVDDRVSIGVVLAQPPFPQHSEDHEASEGQVVKGIEEVWDHVSPVELMIAEGPVMKDGKVAKGSTYQTTGDYIACVTSLGPDVHDVIPEVNSVAANIKFPDKIFRDDIGKALENALPKARALGFEELPEW